MSFSRANFLFLFLFLFIFPQLSIAKGLKNRTKKKEIAVIDNSAYKIVQDTVVINNEVEIHNDTIFNKKYEFKKIILSSKVIADTIWQDANVYSVNFRTENQYDYIPTDPAFGYTGKIKMIKPYKFFRPSEVLNKPRVAMVAGMQGGLYAAANTWWSTD